MGAEMAIEREKLTVRELQILDHLEQAQNLDAPLTEYAAAYNLESLLPWNIALAKRS